MTAISWDLMATMAQAASEPFSDLVGALQFYDIDATILILICTVNK
jgi:hypothetical protein